MKSRTFFTTIGFLLSAFPLLAQSISPDSYATPDDYLDVVTLDEFQVSASSIKDEYIATETTSGTRLAEKITELPYGIQVVTDQFIQDFQLFDDNDAMAFIGGATGSASQDPTSDSGFSGGRMRGFAVRTLRDGFPFGMPGGPSNTRQLSVIRGPMSAVYGRAQPGGILNKESIPPGMKPAYSFTGSYGSADEFARLGGSATGPLAKDTFNNKLFYRAYFDWMKNYNLPVELYGAEMERYFAGITLLYKFRPNTTLSLTAEYQPQRDKNGGRSSTFTSPSNYRGTKSDHALDTNDSVADGTRMGYASGSKRTRQWTGLGDYNTRYSPDVYRDTDFYGANLLFTHRFNPVWSHRTSCMFYIKDTKKLDWDGGTSVTLYDTYRDRTAPGGYRYVWNGTLSERRPYKQDHTQDASAVQTEMLGVFRRPRVEHKLLFALDASYHRTKNKEYRQQSSSDGSPLNPGSNIRMYLDDPWRDPNFGSPILNGFDNFSSSVDTDLTTKTLGAFASYRAALLRRTLFLMASLRYDHYSDKYDNYIAPQYDKDETFDPNEPPIQDPSSFGGKRDDGQFTYSAGVTYNILPGKANHRGLYLYFNVGSTYQPVSTIDNGMGSILPPQEAFGIEFGIKGEGNNNKFGYTLSFYDMSLKNVALGNNDYQPTIHAGAGIVPQYFLAGKQSSRGFDGSFTISPIQRLFIGGGFGLCDNEGKKGIDSSGFRHGSPMPQVAKWNAAFWSSYSFKGSFLGIKLDGLRVGLSATFKDRVTVYYEIDNYYGLEMPSLFLVHGYVSYQFRIRKTSHRIALNIRNLLDKDYYNTAGRPYHGIAPRITYTLNF